MTIIVADQASGDRGRDVTANAILTDSLAPARRATPINRVEQLDERPATPPLRQRVASRSFHNELVDEVLSVTQSDAWMLLESKPSSVPVIAARR